jgi:hypothetical protein
MPTAVRIASPCPTHSRTEWAPSPPVSSRTRSIAASPPFAHDISRPEPASQGNAVGVTTEHDDLLRTEPASGNDTAETHRAITNDGGNFARAHIRSQRRVMASAHHVGERQQRRQTVCTSVPTDSTTPMNSWPMRFPVMFGAIELYGQRSLPQIHARVTRTRASVGKPLRSAPLGVRLVGVRCEITRSAALQGCPAAVGRPKGLRYERPPANFATGSATRRSASRQSRAAERRIQPHQVRGARTAEARSARLLACGTPYALTFGIPSAACDGLRLSP